MDWLGFLSPARQAMTLTAWPAGLIALSPRLVGLLAAAFWTFSALSGRQLSAPAWPWVTLLSYALGSTMALAVLDRYFGWTISPFAVYVTALFAGTGLMLLFLTPLSPWLSRPHQSPRPPSGRALLVTPLLLSPLFFLRHWSLVGVFLLGSATLGLWLLLFLLNLGCWVSWHPRSGVCRLGAALLVLAECGFLALMPALWRLWRA